LALSIEERQFTISVVGLCSKLSSHHTLTSITDAYTYLHLDSSNEYNIKASLYRSADMLDVKPGQLNDAKLDGFFYRKKKGDGDWRPLESE
jgi:hypothetical protein